MVEACLSLMEVESMINPILKCGSLGDTSRQHCDLVYLLMLALTLVDLLMLMLVVDPISTSLPEFMEELECAKKNGKFIQTTAMFVHQYRVQRFMNHVLQDDKFGRITEADASIQLNCNDAEKVGIELPLRKEDGCIRVLGRFCVLVSTMFFNRVGSYAESARVKS